MSTTATAILTILLVGRLLGTVLRLVKVPSLQISDLTPAEQKRLAKMEMESADLLKCVKIADTVVLSLFGVAYLYVLCSLYGS